MKLPVFEYYTSGQYARMGKSSLPKYSVRRGTFDWDGDPFKMITIDILCPTI